MIENENSSNKFFKYFKTLYNRNKKILIISTGLFFISAFLGIIIGYFYSGLTGYLLTLVVNMLKSVIIETPTLAIFLHNLQAILVIYVGGVIGIIPFVSLFSNGFLYGAFIGYLSHGDIINNFGATNPQIFLIYTVPHGIFEIPGFIIASSAGFRLTTMIAGLIKSFIDKTPASDHYWKFKDSIALLVISVILIFIAAMIEANITISIGNYFTGLNLP